MKKALRISGIVLASVLGLILIILAALPFVLNSKAVTKLMDKYAAEYIDGELAYSRLHVSLYRHFPRVGITLEDVAVTYPHERFAQYNTLASPLLDAGRGAEKDTLARFGSLDAAVNAWRLLFGDIRIHRLALDRFAAFGHDYGSAANWDIIRLPESDGESEGFDFPWIRLRELRITGRPRVVYTAQRDSLYADAGFLQFSLEGDAKLSSQEIRLRRLHLALDSLEVFGQLPQDTLSAHMPLLRLDQKTGQLFDLALEADALVSTGAFGRLSVPLSLEGTAGFEMKPERLDLEVPGLDARIAMLPLHLEGQASVLPEHIDLKAAAAIRDCPLNASFDSLRLDRGVGLQARLRDMRNSGRITKVATPDGTMVPRLEITNDDGEIFAKLDSSRMGVQDARIRFSAQERGRPEEERHRRELDALQEQYPDTPRADLAAMLSEQRRTTPPRRHDDFADSDLSIAIDSSLAGLLRKWAPAGSVAVDEGFFASPQLPLRTRLTGLGARFDGDSFDIDSLGLVSGSSDVHASGYLRNIRRALFRHGVLEARMGLESRRINLNEIVAALRHGTPDIGQVDPADEKDESFVTDTLENARIDRDKMSLVVVPGNVKASLEVRADSVDYTDLKVGPVITVAGVQDRTAQILSTHVISDFGRIALDAYYSTQSKEDISAGVNLTLADMDAHDIIHMLPSVDDMMPALKSFEGNLGCELSATTQLDTNMNVVIPSLNGLLRITGQDLEVKDAGDLRRITRLLLFRNKDIGHIDDLSVDAVIHNSQMEVFPFQLGVDRYRLALRRTQGFDKSMYYHASILRSPFLIRFGINLYGTLDNWRFSLGRARYKEGRVPVFTQQLDTVQYNIAEGIRNIFQSGVRHVHDYNLEQERLRAFEDDEVLTPEEQREIDDFALSVELEEQQAALDAEVNEAIAAATLDTDKLMQQYADQIYDKRILRKMEKLKKKQQNT